MTNKSSKHIQTKKHYKKSNKLIAFLVVFIIIAIFMDLKNKINEIYYENPQIILNNQNITANMYDKVLNENNKIYISIDDVKKFLDETIYFESESQTYITTSSKKLACFKENEDIITINGSNQKIDNVIIDKENKKYIAISELKNVYDYEFEYISSTNIIIIDNLDKKQEKAILKKDTNLIEINKKFSTNIAKLQKGEEIVYIQSDKNFSKVRTKKGIIGYVKTKFLTDTEAVREDFIEKTVEPQENEYLEYDLTGKNISTFEKRQNIINLILQQAIKNDKMYVKIIYNEEIGQDYERFKIESKPMLKECGISLSL